MKLSLAVKEWSSGELVDELASALEAHGVEALESGAPLLARAGDYAARASLRGPGALLLAQPGDAPARAVLVTGEGVSVALIEGDERPHVVAGPGHAEVAEKLEPPPAAETAAP